MAEIAKEEALWDLVRDITICMFVTHDGEQLRARPMTLHANEDDQDFEFLASVSSATVKEINGNPEVNLSFAEPKQQDYVSVSGHAEVTQDRAIIRELWNPYAEKFFPGGPDNDDVAVIRVHPERAEYWDSESGTVKSTWNFLLEKAGAADVPRSEHGKLEF